MMKGSARQKKVLTNPCQILWSIRLDTDMNQELIAHGYANLFSGVFGGLQTYMTYSNSVLYAKSGGKGKLSSLAIVALTMVLFVIGPSIASYLPRCMAGTLLLHIGIDLVLEGVYDCKCVLSHQILFMLRLQAAS